MKPFGSAYAAMDWIIEHAHGPVEVYVFGSDWTLFGYPDTNGKMGWSFA